jgi:hypothetical protein
MVDRPLCPLSTYARLLMDDEEETLPRRRHSAPQHNMKQPTVVPSQVSTAVHLYRCSYVYPFLSVQFFSIVSEAQGRESKWTCRRLKSRCSVFGPVTS